MKRYRVYFRLSTECYVDIEAQEPQSAEAILRFDFPELIKTESVKKGSQGIYNIVATYLKEDK